VWPVVFVRCCCFFFLRHLEGAQLSDPFAIGEASKILIAAAVGWTGRIAAERNKRRIMRKHLYRELGNNYGEIRKVLRWAWEQTRPTAKYQVDQSAVDSAMSRAFEALNYEYYRLAKKDLNTFYSLRESYVLEGLYKYLGSDPHSGDYFLGHGFCHEVEIACLQKQLNPRHVRRNAEKWAYELLAEQLASDEEDFKTNLGLRPIQRIPDEDHVAMLRSLRERDPEIGQNDH
jgi:hypothetical protein